MLSTACGKISKKDSNVNKNLLVLDHHVTKARSFLSIEKLTPKELYSISLLKNNIKPSSAKYNEKLFRNNNLQGVSKKAATH